MGGGGIPPGFCSFGHDSLRRGPPLREAMVRAAEQAGAVTVVTSVSSVGHFYTLEYPGTHIRVGTRVGARVEGYMA